MRILFLTPENPYPARGGGAIKSATLLDYLKPRHQVDVMYLQSADGPGPGERTPVNLLRSYAAGIPLSIFRNRSARFSGLVRERLADEPYDAVVADSWLMAQYVPPTFEGLRTLHQHNAEFVMWEREAAMQSNPVRRLLVRREAARVRRYEASILEAFDVVFAVSEPDREALQALGDGARRIELLPNVAQPGLLELPALSPSGAEPVILYLGTLSWPPNERGLRDFLRHVLPIVRARLPGARLVVAGRGASRGLAQLVRRSPGAEMAGAFDDPELLYRRGRAFVEVARGGSGTGVKVLNALARGLPVVTTRDGAEGLAIRAGEHALVGTTAAELSDALVRVLTEDPLWTTLAENGRRLVRERYVPEVAYQVLDEVFAGEGR